MLRLKCPSQNYAWGRLARSNSEVAALAAAAGVNVDHAKPYAELWMGTHPSGPAMLAAASDTCLQDWLESHPEALGTAVRAKFGVKLPFLFKVLSVETALSIQSHPDKELAQRLHAERPEIYKDNNHKPEMALAITDFEALCGFVNLTELSQALQSVPELLSIVGQQHAAAVCASKDKPANSSSARQALKQAFTALMTADSSQVAEFVEMLDDRLRQQQQHRQLTAKEQLVMRLHQQYPHDVGVLSVFFLNLLKLKPGEAIFLPANEPHAYISGQLVECMATSDNVIRAGLTPKLRDTEVLCSSLNYHQGPPEMLHGENVQEYTQLYSPPFEEFEVYKISLPAGADTIIPANKGPTVVLVMKGSGYIEATSNISDKKLLREVQTSKGDVFFIPAQTALAQLSAGAQGLELWIAACNSKVFASQFELPNGVTNGHQVTQGGNTTDGHKLANVINIANGHKVTNGDVHVKPAVKSAVAV